MERKPLGVLFTLFLLSAAGVVVKIGGSRMCLFKSERFTGLCLNDYLCKSVCKTEFSLDGKCGGGLHFTCFCLDFC
uniref:Defensin Tk-AMP-D4 isoform X3 n=1 Tax=Cicer arietinum TaxID=3827 RepID=A0A3Q7XCQ5_CICAR|nr:defensin Tk-AMP-D4 isoform X3 [Cicer arietinum]